MTNPRHGSRNKRLRKLAPAMLLLAGAAAQLSGFTGEVAWAEEDLHSKYIVFVASKDDDTVSVIDAATNSVIDVIPVDDGPVHLAYSRKHKLLFTANENARSVTVIDAKHNEVIGTVANVGNRPDWVSVTPDGRKVYVADFGSTAISVIDTATWSVRTVDVGGITAMAVMDRKGRYLYLTLTTNASVVKVDTKTDTVAAFIDIQGDRPLAFPIGVTLSPDDTRLYAATIGIPSFTTVVDLEANAIIAQVDVGDSPREIVFRTGHGEQQVWVANHGEDGFPAGNTVSVIDADSNTAIDTITLSSSPARPRGIGVLPDKEQTLVYVTGEAVEGGASLVFVIDALSHNVVATIPVGPKAMAVAAVKIDTHDE